MDDEPPPWEAEEEFNRWHRPWYRCLGEAVVRVPLFDMTHVASKVGIPYQTFVTLSLWDDPLIAGREDRIEAVLRTSTAIAEKVAEGTIGNVGHHVTIRTSRLNYFYVSARVDDYDGVGLVLLVGMPSEILEYQPPPGGLDISPFVT